MIDFRCYLITDRQASGGRALPDALREAAEAGIRAVQIREKDLSPAALLALVSEVRDALAPFGTRVLVNDRADIAAITGTGVHLTSRGLPPGRVRPLLAPGALIGVSTHTLAEARAAEVSGADFLVFGPVFATPSKAAFGPPPGQDGLREVCAAVRIPVFALGGITPERVPACLDAGAHGVAAIRALLDVPDIGEAVARFAEALGGL
jgi:thiamine-phosphate pyrophosphorylase